MAQVGTRLGGKAFNHSQSAQAEEEYDRLRNLARQEHGKMQSCFDRAHQAYASGDSAEAHALSTSGKQHQASAASYNAQASAFIFRENNAPSRVPADTIDLHGQYVDEAAAILEARIRAAKEQGQTHLHVIVGKGNHSPGHIRKIEPEVERICGREGLRFRTEENEGRVFVDLAGGGAEVVGGGYGGGQQQQQPQQYQQGAYGGYGGGGGGGQQQQEYQQQQQQQPYPQQQQYPAYNQGYQGRPPQQQQQQQQFEQEQQQQQQDPLTSCIKACCIVM